MAFLTAIARFRYTRLYRAITQKGNALIWRLIYHTLGSKCIVPLTSIYLGYWLQWLEGMYLLAGLTGL